jgi:aubergine-like protein
MQINDTLVKFSGRVLPIENIVQGSKDNEKKYKAPEGLDWTRQANSTYELSAILIFLLLFFLGNPMFSTKKISNWFVVYPARMEQTTANFINVVQECGGNMGMTITDPMTIKLNDDKHATYVNQLEVALSRRNPQIVVCCVPNNRGDRYGAIKKKLCVDRAVPSQVLTEKAMNAKGLRSVAAKVAIQINCKIGGAPWAVDIPLKNVMIVGFDASHDTMHKGLLYGAMVATINNTLSRYFSTVSAHKSGEELSNQISLNLFKALETYAKFNKQLPNRIIIYRDGVGDGQIPYVHKHEIGLIKVNSNIKVDLHFFIYVNFV